ncbi:hypothetical protein KF947_17880 [Halomonas sp. FeN2]|uniref:hypothetical protein n=1 Tax=Halomonas sp. FeN2 TaxID=2832500 RepID=UPI001D0BD291|nr:hypothetical protein [Halomonas sp. FeN2]UBR52189.1 hypothetical protein KF947_17880 [Halomonas sp. FeN2]
MIHLGDGAEADQVVQQAEQFGNVHSRYPAAAFGEGEAAAGVSGAIYTEPLIPSLDDEALNP